MTPKYYIIMFLMVILAFNNTKVFSQENNWKLKKNKNGIEVYTRKDKTIGNIEFKANIELETTIDTLIKVFKDVNAYTEWMADSKVSKILRTISNTERYIYIEVNVPWPLENRDMPIFEKTTITSKGVKIVQTGKPNYIPKKDKITRMEEVVGYWQFIPLPNNKVKVTYQFMTDPGLNIPNWIKNLFIVDGPYKTLTNLKSIVEL